MVGAGEAIGEHDGVRLVAVGLRVAAILFAGIAALSLFFASEAVREDRPAATLVLISIVALAAAVGSLGVAALLDLGRSTAQQLDELVRLASGDPQGLEQAADAPEDGPAATVSSDSQRLLRDLAARPIRNP